MTEVNRWQQWLRLADGSWRHQAPSWRQEPPGHPAVFRPPQFPGGRRHSYRRRQQFLGQRQQSWVRGGGEEGVVAEGEGEGWKGGRRSGRWSRGKAEARGRAVEHNRNVDEKRSWADLSDEEIEAKVLSPVEITTLGGAVACIVQVESESDQEELAKAVSNELHLPEDCFQLVITDSTVNIVFKRDYYGWDILFDRACEFKDDICARNVIKALDDNESFFYFRPLHLAIFHQSPSIVKLLLDLGADPNAETTNGLEQAIHIAARSADQESLELLLAAKIDVNSENSDGDRPLHLAACRRDASFVRLLLDAKADIMAENNFGETALASVKYSNDEDVRKVLSERLLSN